MFCTLFGHMSHIPNVCVSAQCINKENFVISGFHDTPLVINDFEGGLKACPHRWE